MGTGHWRDLRPRLDMPFARAARLMFLITEVRPFSGGNGRLARAIMNAETSPRPSPRRFRLGTESWRSPNSRHRMRSGIRTRRACWFPFLALVSGWGERRGFRHEVQRRGSLRPTNIPQVGNEQRGPIGGPAVILAQVSTNQLRPRDRAYCTISIMLKIGRYIATIMPPTITPRNRIIIGSSMLSRPDTATSTSSS